MRNDEPGDGDDVTSPRLSLDVAGESPVRDGDKRPNLIAGRYELGQLIGSGATARVYRGVDRRLGREVAIKVYEHHVVAVEQLRRAREKTVQASIDHPRVVALFDSGTDHAGPYLVMQLVDGENLAERLVAGPLPADEVTELGIQLADALAHVHARRVVHRDLKPANILLGSDGPLIGDFGIAHELDSTHITGTGLVTGTAAYLAPEQIVGEPAGPAADVYALGLILLECLTAEREYPGTLAESAMARLHRAPRIPAGLPKPLAHTLSVMTAREPADRPAAEQIPQLLRQAPAVLSSTPVPVPDATPAPPPKRRTPAAAGGLAAAAAAAVLAVVLTRPDVPEDTPARPPAAQPTTFATSAPAGATAPTASAVAATSPMTESAAPGLAAVAPPKHSTPSPGGSAGAGTGNGPGKAKGKDKGKGNGKNSSGP
ncbi:protein kinase domain-containing protein [Amycolatopsis sp. cmx-4-61]|uniref:serine/threonine-protein kinase n=1 Tax=Amycolatopsis sp. cmx-4-61 TaxID=2790937 RepID=UPI00397A3810